MDAAGELDSRREAVLDRNPLPGPGSGEGAGDADVQSEGRLVIDPAMTGVRLVHLSDLHFGSHCDLAQIAALDRLIPELAPGRGRHLGGPFPTRRDTANSSARWLSSSSAGARLPSSRFPATTMCAGGRVRWASAAKLRSTITTAATLGKHSGPCSKFRAP
jgi:hypothetical protein